VAGGRAGQRRPRRHPWLDAPGEISEQLLRVLLETDRAQHEALRQRGDLSTLRYAVGLRRADVEAVLPTVLRLIDEAVADDGARRATGT
jgi:hypothetical protein